MHFVDISLRDIRQSALLFLLEHIKVSVYSTNLLEPQPVILETLVLNHISHVTKVNAE